jgi:PTH1 family peptidyl-tRNA hydrolase
VNNPLFIGLGNPGKKYEMTRHNLGFLVVQAFAHGHGLKFREEPAFHSHVAKGIVGRHSIALLMPTTYMNDSGRAVKAYLDYYKLTLSDIVVVSDDIALEFEDMRLRPSGSAGGHNGLKSIQFHLGTSEYARLRMGIGRGSGQSSFTEHVLDMFNPEELKKLPGFITKGAWTLEQLLTSSLSLVMNKVNVKLEKYPPHEGVGDVKHE